MSRPLRQRIAETSRHLTVCTSCSTCEAQNLVHALQAVLDVLDAWDAEPDHDQRQMVPVATAILRDVMSGEIT